MSMKIFLNYFTSNLILRNILQNLAIYLFQYFVSYITVIKNGFANILKIVAIYSFKDFVLHITVFPQNDAFSYNRKNQSS